jgi:hypothetical protein
MNAMIPPLGHMDQTVGKLTELKAGQDELGDQETQASLRRFLECCVKVGRPCLFLLRCSSGGGASQGMRLKYFLSQPPKLSVQYKNLRLFAIGFRNSSFWNACDA